jgi:diaminopimelate epimerase
MYKMTGSGNDFVMIDGRNSRPEDWTPEDIRAVCARGTGVGADGVVFVAPGSEAGAVRMTYFNSDGSRAAMCGNAALCSAWLAARLGIAPAAEMRLETDAGVYRARHASADSRVELGLPPVDPPREVPGLAAGPGEALIAIATVGVPHLVIRVADVDQVDIAGRGAALRSDPALGSGGANVNFVSEAPDGCGWRMRTYERGVEAETLACGTGAVAAACALAGWSLAEPPVTIVTQSGRRLDVQARRLPGGQYGDVWLTGEARLVFRGVLA